MNTGHNEFIPPYYTKKYLNTYVNEYETGNVNPIKRDVVKFIVNIDSTFRTNVKENTNDFTYEFQVPIKNILSYEINSIELPSVWYDISSYKKNNEFTIKIHNYNDGSNNYLHSTHTIRLPDGNYSVDELKSYINNYFTNTANGLDFLLFDIDFVSIHSIFRTKNTSNGESPDPYNDSSSNNFYSPNFSFEIYFDLEEDIQKRQELILNPIDNYTIRDYRKNLGRLLGFDTFYYKVDATNTLLDTFKTSPSILYKGILVSEWNYGANIDRYVLLHIDDFNKNVKDNIVLSNREQTSISNIVAKIQITSPSYTMIHQSKGDSIFRKRTFFGPVDIKRLRIKLLNKYGDLIDLNNSNYSFTIEFTQIYS